MTLGQIKAFSEACAQRKFAERAHIVHDMAVAFHAELKPRMDFLDQLERAGGRK